MNLDLCPLCFRQVIFNGDGTCPSCGKSAEERATVDSSRVLARIKPGKPLPEVCHQCGIFTRQTKLFFVSLEPQNATITSSGFAGTLVRLLWPMRLFNFMERTQKTIDLTVRVPTCDWCALDIQEVKPHYIDFEDRRVDLVVHPEFKKALSQ